MNCGAAHMNCGAAHMNCSDLINHQRALTFQDRGGDPREMARMVLADYARTATSTRRESTSCR